VRSVYDILRQSEIEMLDGISDDELLGTAKVFEEIEARLQELHKDQPA
jgi:hypothetical protein